MAFKIFLYTNVLADHLLDRNRNSSEVIRAVESGRVIAFASSASFFTLAVIIEKKLKMNAGLILDFLCRLLTIVPTSQANLVQAFASRFADLEDAFQYYTAKNITDLDFFVTNNVKDFASVAGKPAVISANEFVEKFL